MIYRKKDVNVIKKEKDIYVKTNLIIKLFNKEILGLLTKIEHNENGNSDIIWLRTTVDFVLKADNNSLIERCHEKIWTYRDQIEKRELTFFLEHDYDRFIKKDKHQLFMHTLMNTFKRQVHKVTPEEVEMLWEIMDLLLYLVAEYKILNDYN